MLEVTLINCGLSVRACRGTHVLEGGDRPYFYAVGGGIGDRVAGGGLCP